MSTKKAEVTKIKKAVVPYKDDREEGQITATENTTTDGFDIEVSEDDGAYTMRLSRLQWKAIKKAVKSLKKGNKNHVVEEPEPTEATANGVAKTAAKRRVKKHKKKE